MKAMPGKRVMQGTCKNRYARFRGPRGAQGPVGPVGPMGPKGDAGERGPAGHDLYVEMRRRGYAGRTSEMYNQVYEGLFNASMPAQLPITGHKRVIRICSVLTIAICLLFFMFMLVSNQIRISKLEQANEELQQMLYDMCMEQSETIGTSAHTTSAIIPVTLSTTLSPSPSPTVQPSAAEVKKSVVPVAAGEEELLIRLVIAESGNQPYEGQVAVAQVVCDRYTAGYGNSITEVIYAKGQFARPYDKDITDYELAAKAVHAVLYEGERAFDETVLFFCNPAASDSAALKWMRTKPYIGTIAEHEFYGG